jgi:DNA polymerase III alpha subunit
MSKEILFLKDYNITDTGQVVIKHDALVEMFRNNNVVPGLLALEDADTKNNDLRKYNQRHPYAPIMIAQIDGKPELPPVEAYKFVLPENYLDLDLDEYFAEKLIEKFPDPSDVYTERLVCELEMMRDREMEDFLRTLIYMTDIFEQNGVVHGVGRGSSCASLVLFLIGIHMVDPVQYDIPIEEFLR